MTTTEETTAAKAKAAHNDRVYTLLHNRVPQVNVAFWVIKVLSTTVGETCADYLNETVGLGLPNTTYIMMSFLVVAMAAQFYTSRYNVPIYWLVVVLISIVGTLVTDNLTDGLGLELWISTVVFSILLVIAFSAWYWKEGTLSFHSVVTRRREAFYWVAILFTFSLGTAGGDLITEGWGLGYSKGTILFAGLIGLVGIVRYMWDTEGVITFWAAYILTRPLGATIGDLLSQDKSDGGLELGTTATNLIFLSVILVLVIYVTFKVARERKEAEGNEEDTTTKANESRMAETIRADSNV